MGLMPLSNELSFPLQRSYGINSRHASFFSPATCCEIAKQTLERHKKALVNAYCVTPPKEISPS